MSQSEENTMIEIATETRIIDVQGVAVPVSDQDRALRFYVDKLGFEVRRDLPMADGGRWIQVAAPGATTTIALVAVGGGGPIGFETGITFTSPDVEADHADLLARGVDVEELLRWPGVPTMFAFRDEDGNGLKIIETT
jgi:catechol 2,3-dioxygenase-like lactoylglutathione lyase family enzyme